MNFAWALTANGWLGLIVLSILQVVLGVDNIVLLTILAGTLKPDEQARARKLGVIVAMVSRLILLFFMAELARLDKPFAKLMDYSISGKAILFGVGGLFLIAKATQEMYRDVEHADHEETAKPASSLRAVLVQIFVLDIVFSLDQVITAVGLVHELSIQVLSILVSVAAMLLFVNKLASFLGQHPSVRILALSFLVLIGVSLVAQSGGVDFPHTYIYFAMAYAVGVEALNLRRRKNVQKKKVESRSDSGP